MAYRLILGREPESEKVVAKHAIPNRTLDDLRRSFLTSEEFGVRFGKLTTATPNDMGCEPLVWTTIQVEVDVSAEHLAKMVERIEREFKHMGETEPHWSVISAEQFKSENIQTTSPSSSNSGNGVVDDLRAATARCGVALDKFETCFELGCGLGRSTIWLADRLQNGSGSRYICSTPGIGRKNPAGVQQVKRGTAPYQHAVRSGKTRSIRRVFFDHRAPTQPTALDRFHVAYPD